MIFSIEDGIVEWFRELGMGKYIKKFVESGYNQFSELAVINEDQMKHIVWNNGCGLRLLISVINLYR